MLAGEVRYRPHFVLVLHHRDHLGNQAVEAGVGAVGEAAQFVGDHALGGQPQAQGVAEALMAGGLSRGLAMPIG